MIDLGVMSDGFYLIDSGIDLANGIYNAADNAAKATTAALNPALWGYVPVHAGGVSKAAIGVALSAVDTARNAVTLAIRIMQAQAFREMSAAAAEQRVWEGSFQMLLNAHEVGLAARLSPLTSLEAIEP